MHRGGGFGPSKGGLIFPTDFFGAPGAAGRPAGLKAGLGGAPAGAGLWGAEGGGGIQRLLPRGEKSIPVRYGRVRWDMCSMVVFFFFFGRNRYGSKIRNSKMGCPGKWEHVSINAPEVLRLSRGPPKYCACHAHLRSSRLAPQDCACHGIRTNSSSAAPATKSLKALKRCACHAEVTCSSKAQKQTAATHVPKANLLDCPLFCLKRPKSSSTLFFGGLVGNHATTRANSVWTTRYPFPGTWCSLPSGSVLSRETATHPSSPLPQNKKEKRLGGAPEPLQDQPHLSLPCCQTVAAGVACHARGNAGRFKAGGPYKFHSQARSPPKIMAPKRMSLLENCLKQGPLAGYELRRRRFFSHGQ